MAMEAQSYINTKYTEVLQIILQNQDYNGPILLVLIVFIFSEVKGLL